MKCLECQADVSQLNNEHLGQCCGLTLQEYAIRHHMSLDLLVSESMVNADDNPKNYSLPVSRSSVRGETILKALMCANVLQENSTFIELSSDIRRLDELLWYARELQDYGFQFRQEYTYTEHSHRVIAENKIRTLSAYAHRFALDNAEIDFDLFAAIIIAQCGEMFNGYIFLTLPENDKTKWFLEALTNNHQIRWHNLDAVDNQDDALYRTESLQDGQRLLKLVETYLKQIPCVRDRFYENGEQAVVSKELVFDSAHFITDHPGKCENLHGGRYSLNVKIKGQIDPLTGFVIDYGYLKKVVKQRVINKLDHQALNFVDTDIAWRSSTELLNIYIWEQLIDYLPGLQELQTYETTQSYCTYCGPSLEDIQKGGKQVSLKHFSQPELGKSVLRKQLLQKQKNLKVINK
jgi:6-pyruvoyl tetrahydropterin synthase/QueD family protein